MTETRSDWTMGGTQIQRRRCTRCGVEHYLFVAACAECGSTNFAFEEIRGDAALRAVTVIHRAPHSELQALTPYAVAIAETPDGLRLIGHTSVSSSIGDRAAIGLKNFGGRPMPYFAVYP